MRPGNTVAQVLRIVLGQVGIRVWNEVYSGLSWVQYCCLDVFSTICIPKSLPQMYSVKYLVSDQRESSVYWPNQTEWWAYRLWKHVGQVPAFQEYGPGIMIDHDFVGQATALGIQLPQTTYMTPELFCILVHRNPEVFDIAFRIGMKQFLQQYYASKGKGKGKGMMLEDARL